MDSKNGGTALLIESLPINFDGWIQMKVPQPRDGAGQKQEDKTDLPF